MTKIKSREEMAREYSQDKETQHTPTGVYEDRIDTYLAGFDACHKLMMEEGSKGFEEWWRKSGREWTPENEKENSIIRKAWTAARISTIVEREEREKKLMTIIQKQSEAIAFYGKENNWLGINDNQNSIHSQTKWKVFVEDDMDSERLAGKLARQTQAWVSEEMKRMKGEK
jgi:hypothetical protein